MMQESSMMTEIRQIKVELSNKARMMSTKEFLEYIKKEALLVKESTRANKVGK